MIFVQILPDYQMWEGLPILENPILWNIWTTTIIFPAY